MTNSDNSSIFREFEQIIFPISNKHFSLYIIQSNNLILDYLNILSNQIDFCFPKLHVSPQIRTKIELINNNY